MTNVIKYNKKYIYNYLNNILINSFQETHQFHRRNKFEETKIPNLPIKRDEIHLYMIHQRNHNLQDYT